MGVSILFNNKWKLQDTSISVPALEEKKRYVWVCVYLQASQHLIHSPSTWALWNEQSRTAFLAWSLTKPVNSTEGCAELYSQKLTDRTLRTFTPCVIQPATVPFTWCETVWCTGRAWRPYQDNPGRVSQVEKDKLHVTCVPLFGCPACCREHAVSWAQMGT